MDFSRRPAGRSVTQRPDQVARSVAAHRLRDMAPQERRAEEGETSWARGVFAARRLAEDHARERRLAGRA
jgi:hypothetical protein